MPIVNPTDRFKPKALLLPGAPDKPFPRLP
jgi:hypothetical protein